MLRISMKLHPVEFSLVIHAVFDKDQDKICFSFIYWFSFTHSMHHTRLLHFPFFLSQQKKYCSCSSVTWTFFHQHFSTCRWLVNYNTVIHIYQSSLSANMTYKHSFLNVSRCCKERNVPSYWASNALVQCVTGLPFSQIEVSYSHWPQGWGEWWARLEMGRLMHDLWGWQ